MIIGYACVSANGNPGLATQEGAVRWGAWPVDSGSDHARGALPSIMLAPLRESEILLATTTFECALLAVGWSEPQASSKALRIA
jgi:hypothetical protein